MKKNGFLSQLQYDSIRVLPLGLNYTRVDHQTGLAPYFRETLRAELTKIFRSKDDQEMLRLQKPDGTSYDLYSDGLKFIQLLTLEFKNTRNMRLLNI